MMFRLQSNTCSSPFLSSLIVVLLHISRCIAQAGSISLFLDASCNSPSTIVPTTSVELLTCLVPGGARGVVINLYPACPNGGTARMIIYKDILCSQSTKTQVYKKCNYYSPSFPVYSLMFTCEAEPSEPRPTTTVTATASRLAGVATANPSSSSSEAASSSTSTPAAAATTAAGGVGGGGSSTFVTTTSTGVSLQSPAPTSTTQGSGTSSVESGEMSTSDKIAIGVGVGIGVPTLLVGTLALLVSLGCIRKCW